MTNIETERLLLRNFKQTDLDDLFEYLSDPIVVAFEPYKALTREETFGELKRRICTDEMVAVELKTTHKLIGNVYLGNRDYASAEIGYVFNRYYWGSGYAKEACMPLIKKGFENGTHRLYAECDPLNPHSWRLLEKLDFVREAHLKKNVYFRKDTNGSPIWKDTYIYSRLNPME